MMASVCLSVARLDITRERKGYMKPKIGRMEAHHMSNPWTYLEIKRSKVKVTKLINAETEHVCRLQTSNSV